MDGRLARADDRRRRRRGRIRNREHVRKPRRAGCARRERKLHGGLGGAGPRRRTGLVEDAVSWARAAGFRAVQFNAVAETNAAALALYRSLGFSIVGTVPEAFDHPAHGLVGLHVMHLRLR